MKVSESEEPVNIKPESKELPTSPQVQEIKSSNKIQVPSDIIQPTIVPTQKLEINEKFIIEEREIKKISKTPKTKT